MIIHCSGQKVAVPVKDRRVVLATVCVQRKLTSHCPKEVQHRLWGWMSEAVQGGAVLGVVFMYIHIYICMCIYMVHLFRIIPGEVQSVRCLLTHMKM